LDRDKIAQHVSGHTAQYTLPFLILDEQNSVTGCQQAWLLKNSFSAQTSSNPVIENVYPVRENRL
jgi:hypothetical protein